MKSCGPSTLATPGWRPISLCSALSGPASEAIPGRFRMISVGDSTPGPKPSAAACHATRTGLSRGREVIGENDSRRSRSGRAARTSRAVIATATNAATQRRVSNRTIRPASSSCPSPPGRGGRGQNTARPRTASSAGTSVTEISSAMSTVTARPGPKARNIVVSAATKARTPPATVAPATSTIGRYSTVVARAAVWRSSPWASPRCIPARKKIE